MQTQWDTLWHNATLVPVDSPTTPSTIRDGVIASKDDKITFVGQACELHKPFDQLATNVIDCQGKLITPGLIDCHTHLVYAGNRANEFNARLEGKSYSAIAKAGGGILSTVRATREASEDELVALAKERLHYWLNEGVTTCEIKSGYGLDLNNELKMLRAIKRLQRELPLDIVATYLAAHAMPPEFDAKPAYIDYLCETCLPAVAQAKLAQCVDAFCEDIAFSPSQVKQLFTTAKSLGFSLKCHAEQLTHQGASQMSASLGALSCDHCEYLDEVDVKALASANTTAVLLPGAFYYLNETQKPPIALLQQHQVPIAIATDSNPGSSPVHSLLAVMNMACVLWQMKPWDVFVGVTHYAAKALGREDSIGQLRLGMQADFVMWDMHEVSELCYALGANPCRQIVKNGKFREI